MKPLLTPLQGRIVRALAATLTPDRKDMLMTEADGGLVIESLMSRPWASLTFTGERHHLVCRLPLGAKPSPLDGEALTIAGAIVAVEALAWQEGEDGLRLTLDLLTISQSSILG